MVRITRPTEYEDFKTRLFEISRQMLQMREGQNSLTQDDILEDGRIMIEEHFRPRSERTALLTQTTSYPKWTDFVSAVRNIGTDGQSLPSPVKQAHRDAQPSRKRI